MNEYDMLSYTGIECRLRWVLAKDGREAALAKVPEIVAALAGLEQNEVPGFIVLSVLRAKELANGGLTDVEIGTWLANEMPARLDLAAMERQAGTEVPWRDARTWLRAADGLVAMAGRLRLPRSDPAARSVRETLIGQLKTMIDDSRRWRLLTNRIEAEFRWLGWVDPATSAELAWFDLTRADDLTKPDSAAEVSRFFQSVWDLTADEYHLGIRDNAADALLTVMAERVGLVQGEQSAREWCKAFVSGFDTVFVDWYYDNRFLIHLCLANAMAAAKNRAGILRAEIWRQVERTAGSEAFGTYKRVLGAALHDKGDDYKGPDAPLRLVSSAQRTRPADPSSRGRGAPLAKAA